MRLLFFCKRRPQGRDLLTKPYGRFYHLPLVLARQGHEVTILLCSYKREPDQYDVQDGDGMRWYSIGLTGLSPSRYYRTAKRLAKSIQPDWIIGFSDTWYGILARRISREVCTQSLIDAYDNYESYIPWFKPLHLLWRQSLAKANVVTAAGPQLADFMSKSAGNRLVHVIEMAADPCFYPRSQSACRAKFGLPPDKILFGYSGSLHPSRDIRLLFAVFEKVREVMPNVEMAITGRLSKSVELPSHVRWLGYLPAEDVPIVINSLDLMFAVNKPGVFGNYSYPVKVYEALACGVPVIATDLPGTAWVLRNHPEWLANPYDIDRFVTKIISLIKKLPSFTPVSGWQDSAAGLEKLLMNYSPQKL